MYLVRNLKACLVAEPVYKVHPTKKQLDTFSVPLNLFTGEQGLPDVMAS